MPSITLFGRTIATSSRGAPLPAGLRKLVIAPGIICRLTSSFDGMIDGARSCDETVSGEWVCEKLLKGKAYTRHCYVDRRYGSAIIHVSDACHSVSIDDGEIARRKAAWSELPLTQANYSTPIPMQCAKPHDWLRRAGPLCSYIEQGLGLHGAEIDALTFDDLVEELRPLDLEGVQLWAAAKGLIALAHLEEQPSP